MFFTTLAAALLPGGGYLLLRRRAWAAAFAALELGGAALGVAHARVGLPFFETPQGEFFLAVILRGVAILHAFGVLDAYRLALDPQGLSAPPLKRRAVLLNVLLPGAGYLLARAWVRAATGLLLLTLVVFFAWYAHPYLDIIFLAMQGVMGAAVFVQLQAQEAAREQEARGVGLTDPPAEVQEAQIVILVVLLAVFVWCGYVAQLRLPPPGLQGLSLKDIQVQPGAEGIRYRVPPLGLQLLAAGPGWTAADHQAGYLFHAVHARDAFLAMGIQRVPVLLPEARLVQRVRAFVEHKGFKLIKTEARRPGGAPALLLRFSGELAEGPVEHAVLAVPHGKVVYLLMLSCKAQSCASLAGQFERTLESFRVAG